MLTEILLIAIAAVGVMSYYELISIRKTIKKVLEKKE